MTRTGRMKPLAALRAALIATLLAAPVVLIPPSVASAAGPVVFINEIHYDNAGADAGEAVEVAGPSGTDLSGWSLVLYNGSGGAPYGTIALSGVIPNQQSGFGTLSFATVGLQNGAPDGIALVDAGTVIEFLSYEGTFTAVGGPANGMTSTDIGVSENGSGPAGHSLQLVGTGTEGGDFTWAGSQPNTFGAVNVGQTFVAPVVINEIDYDQAGTDTAEFVELKNVGTSPVDLSALTLEFVNGTGGGATVYDTIPLSGTLAPGDYFVVCANAATVVICDLDDFPDTNFIQNGAPDAIGLRQGALLVDAVSYEGNTGAPYTEGSGVGLEDDASVADAGISRCPDGTDTGQNNADFAFVAITPGATNACSPPIIINEVDSDNPGTDAAEFVELFDGGSGGTDLTGKVLVLFNGGDDKSYERFDLDGQVTDAGGYFVLCGDAGNVANCDLDVSPNTNLIQNGADAVALYDGDAADFPNGTAVTTTDLIDALVYDTNDADDAALLTLLNAGEPQVNEDGAGDKDNHSNQRCPNGSGGARNTSTYAEWAPTPGAENTCAPPPEVCGDPFTPIYVVQGSGAASPLDGSSVSIEGVVVGDFQNNASPDSGELNGFHVQDPVGDGDPATSDGVFVYAPGGIDVAVGDAVRVSGTVDEFNNLTEITSVTNILICSTGNSVAATALSLPVAAADDFEASEGMYVTFPQDLVIAEYFNFDRFNEIVLTSERHLTPTAEFEPGPAALAAAAAFQLDKITLDDGRTNQNPDPAIHPNGGVFDLTNLFRGGDELANVTGVMDYSFGLYRVQPTQGADHTNTNPRTAAPDPVGGRLQVATFNVLNYFTTLDNAGPICGPGGNLGCRGADDAGELTRQRDKIISAIAAIDADVVGLIEIENNVTDGPTADLVAGLNAVMGAGTYDYVPTGAIGTDAIRTALIYKPAAVTPSGAFAVLDSSVNPLFDDTRNRPVLAQTFVENATYSAFTVAVNHFKSKGSGCGPGDDATDGSGNCNGTRTDAATALVDWLAGDPTGSGDADFLIVGDLNSYDKENPIDVLTGAGYSDLVFDYLGEDAYSYVFDGQIGYLDYQLANAPLAAQVTGTTVWHINADEPDLIDYDTSFKKPAQDAIYAPDPYRSSDHDPVIVGLDLTTAQSLKQDARDDLAAALPTGDSKDDKRIEKAIGRIDQSLNPAWWTGLSTLDLDDGKHVFDREKQAAKELMKVGGPVAQAAIDKILEADLILATIQLDIAIANGGDPKDIAKAQGRLADAADEIADGDFDKAIGDYKKAWQNAVKAL